MQIDIQSQGFTLTDGLRDYVMKRLAYRLSHGDESVTRVNVRLSDINGPRGGADKRCVIEIRLKALPAVVIESTETDLYVAIDRASERAGRNLTRSLERQREFVPDLVAGTGDVNHDAQANTARADQ
ncbi:MAG: HPF/RaiA family ribosome-associated protein [Thiobacillus sp.]|nr:HPF/RaiA family ribosome-associated protein [Thiobacillus sp.]